MTCCINIPYRSNPETYFNQLRHLADFVWLDSGRPKNLQGRFDIFTALATDHATVDPSGRFEAKMPFTNINQWVAAHIKSGVSGSDNPKEKSDLEDLPFTGGIIGHFGYHWQAARFKLPQGHQYKMPVVKLAAYDWSLIIDHQQKTAKCVFLTSCLVQAKVTQLLNAKPLESDSNIEESFACTSFRHDTSQDEYLNGLNRINEYILAGDCYQVNFSQRFSAQYSGNLDTAYLQLRNATPSPFSAYIKHDTYSILSVSPERYLHFVGKKVTTQPIKGSCPRGETPEQDQLLANKLKASEKNRAENVMIVDLLRNDLSLSCKPYSIVVTELCQLQSFANVHHLVSTIIGELNNNESAFDLFKKAFPGGSITGAPKKRSMEIINELETSDRGIYCGSIAYFSNNGNADSSIAIRTLQAEENTLYCWGGGGVVADSNAESEYEESLFKVSKLMSALSEKNSSR